MPPLQQRYICHKLILFYKIRLDLTPSYLTPPLPPLSSSSGYPFTKLFYPVPLVKKASTLSGFIPRAIILWNDLPGTVQQLRCISVFKRKLKSLLKLSFASYSIITFTFNDSYCSPFLYPASPSLFFPYSLFYFTTGTPPDKYLYFSVIPYK